MCHSIVPKLLPDMPKGVGGWVLPHWRSLERSPKSPIWPKVGATSNAAKGAASNAAGEEKEEG